MKQSKGAKAAISPEEQDRIIRNYFLLVAEEADALCPLCGEALVFRMLRQLERVEVNCPDCGSRFEWQQSNPIQPFKPLHLKYFVERHQQGLPLRCPIDDSAVAVREFSDGVLEFRCPYCNRRTRTDRPNPTIGNQLLQLT